MQRHYLHTGFLDSKLFAYISSNRGTRFTFQLWAFVAQLLGTQLGHTTAYHLLYNGLVEHFHCHLKPALQARLLRPSFIKEFLWKHLGIRTAPEEDLGCSTTELMYMQSLTVPEDYVPKPNHTPERTSYLCKI